jgi:rod shape-determining protein MreC
MSLRDSQFGELKVPLTWTAAVALIVAAVIAVALLMSDRRETFRAEAYGAARGAADSVLAPVGDVLSAPGRWTGAGVEAIRGYFFAVSENRRLKAELRDMRQWRDVAYALKNENGRYRSLLGLKTDPPVPMVAARVVTDSRGPFADTRIASTGREAGVQVGNPVMSEYGLVGRVIGVTKGASRVLTLTDVASRTPVMVDRTNARAILTGDGGSNPRLEYLRGQDPVRVGDRILTSGDGGVLPRGLPVGVAVKGLDGKWRVVLASDRGPIDFVRILLFQDFTQVINRRELDQLPVPPPTPGEPNAVTAEATAAGSPTPTAAGAIAGGKLAAPPAAPSAALVPAAKPAAASPAASSVAKSAPVTSAAAAAPASVKPTDGKKPEAKKPAATAKPAAGAAANPATPHSVSGPGAAPKAATAKTATPKAATLKAAAPKTAASKPATPHSPTATTPKPAAAKPKPADLAEEPPH